MYRYSSPRPHSPNPNPNPNSDADDSSSSSSSSSDDSIDPHPLYHISPGGRSYTEPIELHSLGSLNIQCPNCHALHFISEKLTNSGVHAPHFGMCCLQGQVHLSIIHQWPCVLQDLFDDPQDPRRFKKKIHQYNNTLAFASMGVDVDN
jgi:hypothetical protein